MRPVWTFMKRTLKLTCALRSPVRSKRIGVFQSSFSETEKLEALKLTTGCCAAAALARDKRSAERTRAGRYVMMEGPEGRILMDMTLAEVTNCHQTMVGSAPSISA